MSPAQANGLVFIHKSHTFSLLLFYRYSKTCEILHLDNFDTWLILTHFVGTGKTLRKTNTLIFDKFYTWIPFTCTLAQGRSQRGAGGIAPHDPDLPPTPTWGIFKIVLLILDIILISKNFPIIFHIFFIFSKQFH